MADAEAICEAVTRPNMQFVAIRSVNQQAVLMLHQARDLLVRQRTMLINTLRAHLAEFGFVSARGPHKIRDLCARFQEDHLDIPQVARVALLPMARQLDRDPACGRHQGQRNTTAKTGRTNDRYAKRSKSQRKPLQRRNCPQRILPPNQLITGTLTDCNDLLGSSRSIVAT